MALSDPERGPCCGGPLEDPPFGGAGETRDVLDVPSATVVRRRYRLNARYSPRCRKPVCARIPGVTPGCRLSNRLLARTAADFYLRGLPAGTVARRLGVGKGTLLAAFGRGADKLAPALEWGKQTIAGAELAQADESPFRIDGRNGYAWVVLAGNLVAFEVPAENNRSEREIRPLAIARKVSHGCRQSGHGAEVRGTWMTVLHTLAACEANAEARVAVALDILAHDQDADIAHLLFGGLDLALPHLSRDPIRELPPEVTTHPPAARPAPA